MDGLAQDCGNSSNNALELPQSCTNDYCLNIVAQKQTRIKLVPEKQSTMSCEANMLICDVSSLIISLIKFKHPNQVDEWFTARLQYLQCRRSEDTAVLN